jgi:hypothetical protein
MTKLVTVSISVLVLGLISNIISQSVYKSYSSKRGNVMVFQSSYVPFYIHAVESDAGGRVVVERKQVLFFYVIGYNIRTTEY